MKRTILTSSFCILLMAVMASAAMALPTSVTYYITSDHATGGLGTPPFGTVRLTQDGANVDFTVHLYSPYYFVQTGSADFQDFKFNATGVTASDIHVTSTNTPYTLVGTAGSYNGDGTGTFGFGIGDPNQPNGAVGRFNSDITFYVANSTIPDFYANSLGILFVADLFSSNLNGLTGTGNTGPADVTPPTVPEPATMLLLGLGLIGMAGVRRFK